MQHVASCARPHLQDRALVTASRHTKDGQVDCNDRRWAKGSKLGTPVEAKLRTSGGKPTHAAANPSTWWQTRRPPRWQTRTPETGTYDAVHFRMGKVHSSMGKVHFCQTPEKTALSIHENVHLQAMATPTPTPPPRCHPDRQEQSDMLSAVCHAAVSFMHAHRTCAVAILSSHSRPPAGRPFGRPAFWPAGSQHKRANYNNHALWRCLSDNKYRSTELNSASSHSEGSARNHAKVVRHSSRATASKGMATGTTRAETKSASARPNSGGYVLNLTTQS